VRRTYRARRLALQALCCLDAQGNKVWNLVEDFIADSDEAPEAISTARKLTTEAFDLRPEADRILTRHAHNWELDRLAMVDRNILRLSVAELLIGGVPTNVVISEALRLAKEFSSAESPRFVNGVLDAVAREIRKDVGKSISKDEGDVEQ
jgi:transcription antitermination protein NusB